MMSTAYIGMYERDRELLHARSLQAVVVALAQHAGYDPDRCVTRQSGDVWYVYRDQASLDRELTDVTSGACWFAIVRAVDG